MNSEQLARVYERAERRWFNTALRARLDDGERLAWKERFCVRAATLLSRWEAVANTPGG
jgi:hypothetical protein